MSSLRDYEAEIKNIVEKNGWTQTPNVTLLEAIRKVLAATDKWRRKHSPEEVVEDILESVFFLLATCVKLNHNMDLDKLFSQVCKSKEGFSFEDVPDDLVWSFIVFSTEPHVNYSQRREPTAI